MTKETTKNPDTLLKALFEVQKAAPIVKKSADNPFFKSKYADLPAVWSAVQDLMAQNGLLVTHQTKTLNDKDFLVTAIHHVSSGEKIESESQLHLQKANSQEYGSCVTYMRRYAISALLGLVTDDDDDGNDSVQDKPAAKTPAKKEPPKEEIKPVDGTEFLAIQKAIKSATVTTFTEEKAKARAAWPRMSEAHRKTILKTIETKEAEIKADDKIPSGWDEQGNPVHE